MSKYNSASKADKFANMEKEAKGYFRNHPDVPSDPIRKLINLGAGAYKVRAAIKLIKQQEINDAQDKVERNLQPKPTQPNFPKKSVLPFLPKERTFNTPKIEAPTPHEGWLNVVVNTDDSYTAENIFLALLRSDDVDIPKVTVTWGKGAFTYEFFQKD
jgi:hypothetical protein